MPRPRLSSNAVLAIVVVVLAILLGAAIAIASSPGSLGASTTRSGALTTPTPTPSETPTPLPSPSPTPGALGRTVRLIAGRGFAFASGATGSYLSTDGGATWTAVKPPNGTATVIADAGNGTHLIAGGTSVESSRDAGRTWAPPRTQPPLGGPIQPLWINRADGTIWLISRGGHLVRTRDDGVSWREVANAPALSAPFAVEGGKDQVFVADGGRVLQVDGNGDSYTDRGQLPNGQAVVTLAVLTPAGALLAEGAGGTVYTNASGSTWTQTDKTGTVAGMAATVAWVAGATPVLSTDGAKTWQPMTGLPANDPTEAMASDGTKSYAYTLSGAVYTSADLGKTWTATGKIS